MAESKQIISSVVLANELLDDSDEDDYFNHLERDSSFVINVLIPTLAAAA